MNDLTNSSNDDSTSSQKLSLRRKRLSTSYRETESEDSCISSWALRDIERYRKMKAKAM